MKQLMSHESIQDLFRYHPDPIATGSVKTSDLTCICCNQQRGYIYALDENAFCPWCIADGSAAKKYDAWFSDPTTLWNERISKSIIAEVSQRTPGYIGWQGADWLAHCDDACEYRGQATARYLKGITQGQKDYLLKELRMDEEDWARLMSEIPSDESCLDDPEIHLFACRHCNEELYHISYS
jgi:uncharacterized protein CbrC (UPF0167 family)